jgi:DNA polymerase-3 subunit epsilon
MTGREIVFDTETTGLAEGQHRIIEFGGVEIYDLLPTGRTFHCFINPMRKNDPGAFAVHGISDDFLATQPTMRKQMPRILEFIGDARLVAHNAPFDVKFMNAELDRLEMPRLRNEVVDTLDLSRKVKPGGAHSLDALCRHFKVKRAKERTKHGALIDSELLAEVYQGLRGGLQIGLGLAGGGKVAEPVPEVTAVWPQRHFPGPSLEEEIAHREFVRTLGPSPVWGQYLNLAEVELEELDF